MTSPVIRRRVAASILALLMACAGLLFSGATPASADSPWVSQSATANYQWMSVVYGNGLFVAVADGMAEVMTSPDGATWTAQGVPEASGWTSVTFGNGLFVAVASYSTGGFCFFGSCAPATKRVMTSSDGITWTAQSAAEANSWRSVTYGNGLFVAVSPDGTNRVMTSPDGITWTARSAAEANSWLSVTYGNGLFVAVSPDGTNRVMTSPDGITWTARSAAAETSWRAVTFGDGRFVAVSTGLYPPPDAISRVMTSTDGVTWTAQSAIEENAWFSVTYGNGLFVAVANDGGANRVMTSPDGATWSPMAAAADINWKSVTFGNNTFVAVSSDGEYPVMTWQQASAPAAPTSLEATAGDGSASISFTAGSDGGAAITKYQYSLDEGLSWNDANGTTSPLVIPGFVNYTTYSIKLRAVNSAGNGAPSSSVSTVPAYAAPVQSAPTVGGARRSILASWSLLPVNAQHDRIKLYRAAAYLAGTNTKVRTCMGGATETSCEMKGLSIGTAYDVRIEAVHLAGKGPSKTVRRSLMSASRSITLN